MGQPRGCYYKPSSRAKPGILVLACASCVAAAGRNLDPALRAG